MRLTGTRSPLSGIPDPRTPGPTSGKMPSSSTTGRRRRSRTTTPSATTRGTRWRPAASRRIAIQQGDRADALMWVHRSLAVDPLQIAERQELASLTSGSP